MYVMRVVSSYPENVTMGMYGDPFLSNFPIFAKRKVDENGTMTNGYHSDLGSHSMMYILFNPGIP